MLRRKVTNEVSQNKCLFPLSCFNILIAWKCEEWKELKEWKNGMELKEF